MSRNTLMTLLLIIVSLLLAVALFIAGAMWRGRATARTSAVESKRSFVNASPDQIAENLDENIGAWDGPRKTQKS